MPAHPCPVVRDLTPRDWPHLERLFGPNGACGGCWCMTWRLPRLGVLWEERKGEPNRREFRRRVRAGRVTGCLAFLGDEPVGWVDVGPREGFVRMARCRSLPQEVAAGTWVVACFFVPRARRRAGVARALLRGALDLARRSGAARLEGYPVRVAPGERYADAFAHTGVPRLFERSGFRDVTPDGASRPIYRHEYRHGRRRRRRSG